VPSHDFPRGRWNPSRNCPPKTSSNACAAASSNCAGAWPRPSTGRPRARSSTPPRRPSATCSPPSARPPSSPPCSCDWMPRKRLPPPPQHPETRRPLQNKGPEARSVLTVNGRIGLVRRRYAAAGAGSCHPLDTWLDGAEESVSLGLRELACRLNLASRNFDRAADNLARAAQVPLSGELLRQVVEAEGRAARRAAQAGPGPVAGAAARCPAPG